MLTLHGDSLELLKELPDNSVDSIVTDPPYGLSFMGKKWDYDVPTTELWAEALRVLKPGGHLLAFFGTRTYHRGVVRIEDAGFEIRDQVMWIYGSGFPKSLDVSKAIDKAAGAEREKVPRIRLGDSKQYETTQKGWKNLSDNDVQSSPDAVTEAAKQWQGWGTALKPANEPIVVARKPLEGTVAHNVQKYGTGGLKIDASRIAIDPKDKNLRPNGSSSKGNQDIYGKGVGAVSWENTMDVSKGRWPANILFDEEAAAVLDEQSGQLSKQGSRKLKDKPSETFGGGSKDSTFYGDSGGASRFFYVAKASKRERGDGNSHPTVKPIKLMEYLVTMVTPPGGIVLDPFMGSGTTGVACQNKGFEFIGIEREAEYVEIAEKRINAAKKESA